MVMLSHKSAGLHACASRRWPIVCPRSLWLVQGLRSRSTLSKIWVPTGTVTKVDGETGHEKLIRAGFLRQVHSGIFQLLPLGLRVQDKIESLLDKHMASIGASKLSLSAFTSEDLWRRSGRLDAASAELFRLTDRNNTTVMLSPTHEEEITTLVANTLKSYKDLPLRLYQTTRKYRDEMRPRHGLLRSREFVMKDLYTFDTTSESAIAAYEQVAGAYRAFFAEMGVPILVAEASSGDMGGNHSHEYHLVNPIGEDIVISCDTCGYAANDEVATSRTAVDASQITLPQVAEDSEVQVWRGVTRDRRTLVNAWYPSKNHAGFPTKINTHAVKKAVPDLDSAVNNAIQAWNEAAPQGLQLAKHGVQILNVLDIRLRSFFDEIKDQLPVVPVLGLHSGPIPQHTLDTTETGGGFDLLHLLEGDGCPRCESGKLTINRALELGHTFYLGARYSDPLRLSVTVPPLKSHTHIEMGCYGIGVSRIIGAIAEHTSDDKGLQWPRAIAPFEIVVIPTADTADDALRVFDELTTPSASGSVFDAVLDDRRETFGWKMQDADLIGYPITIVLGRAWREGGLCEVQCRSKSLKENIAVGDLPTYLRSLLSQI